MLRVASSQDFHGLTHKPQTHPSSFVELYDLSVFVKTFFFCPTHLPNETPYTYAPNQSRSFPNPAAHPTRLSPILTAEYIAPGRTKHVRRKHPRSPSARNASCFNADFLKSYLEGQSRLVARRARKLVGSKLQEAWEMSRLWTFVDSCEWIHERDNAALEAGAGADGG